jgi:hypothetical protein
LRSLDLSHNKIKMLPKDIFRPMALLRELDLENNNILTLPAEIFQGMSLSLLHLLHNSGVKCVPLSAEQFKALLSFQGPETLCSPSQEEILHPKPRPQISPPQNPSPQTKPANLVGTITQNSSQSNDSSNISQTTIIGIAAGIGGGLLVVVGTCLICLHYRRKRRLSGTTPGASFLKEKNSGKQPDFSMSTRSHVRDKVSDVLAGGGSAKKPAASEAKPDTYRGECPVCGKAVYSDQPRTYHNDA